MIRLSQISKQRLTEAAAFAFVAGAILATSIHFQTQKPVVASRAPPHRPDPLADQLAHCRSMEGLENLDDTCRLAWMEMRRRFFTPHGAADGTSS